MLLHLELERGRLELQQQGSQSESESEYESEEEEEEPYLDEELLFDLEEESGLEAWRHNRLLAWLDALVALTSSLLGAELSPMAATALLVPPRPRPTRLGKLLAIPTPQDQPPSSCASGEGARNTHRRLAAAVQALPLAHGGAVAGAAFAAGSAPAAAALQEAQLPAEVGLHASAKPSSNSGAQLLHGWEPDSPRASWGVELPGARNTHQSAGAAAAGGAGGQGAAHTGAGAGRMPQDAAGPAGSEAAHSKRKQAARELLGTFGLQNIFAERCLADRSAAAHNKCRSPFAAAAQTPLPPLSPASIVSIGSAVAAAPAQMEAAAAASPLSPCA